jgi:hypothetical protein
MLRGRRRLLILVILGLVARTTYVRRRSQAAQLGAPAPVWPPHEELAAPPSPDEIATIAPIATTASTGPEGASETTWRPAIDGGCPDGFPVKANERSGIFHVPGGRFYARTVPERCYATPEDAVADGYRAAKA